MKLAKKVASEIAEKCAIELITHLGENEMHKLPYDAILSEMAEMIEDIEDKIDTIVNSQVEKTMTNVQNIEELWGT